ncbi:MAG: nucleotide exchange factor GrpE [Patescibacteria group bacterium]|nr:nucleotide exchange factor GrpE [Patescibacteria group bacterium]
MSEPDDEIIAEDEAEAGPAALKKMRERLAQAVKEKQEYLEGWQRARADFVNYKKEEGAREGRREERIKEELAEAVIPALDAFEMAFKSPAFEKAPKEWRAGMAGLYGELLKSLSKFGIMSFSPVGEHFDPRRHDAAREVPVEEKEKEHAVISVERSGYLLGERVIRPAQVSVGIHKKS